MPWPFTKTELTGRKFVIVILCITAAFIGTYFWEINSPAYKVASEFVYSCAACEVKLGKITGVGMSTLGSMSETGEDGRASLVLRATGSRGSGRVGVTLIETDGVWQVATASLDRVPISTNR